jgi:hypothetical protein
MFHNGNCFKKNLMFGENVIPIAERFHYSPPPYGRRSETVFLNFSGAQESIPAAYVACMWGRYENPIPTRFLAPIDSSKIQYSSFTPNHGLTPVQLIA